jgi:hypothetical protein
MLALETAGYPTKSPVMAQAAKDTTTFRLVLAAGGESEQRYHAASARARTL